MSLKTVLDVHVACILVVSIFAPLATMDAEAKEGDFGGGDGTAGNPYVIEDVRDLQNMSSDLDACYVLGNDIDASDTVNWNSGAGFVPVGDSTSMFNGSLDGNNHTVSGLFIDRTTTDCVGLLGFVGPGSSVNNIGLVDCDVTGRYVVGGLVGQNRGTVQNSYGTGKFTALGSLGGLVGFNDNGTVNGSLAVGDVTATIEYIGGLVGYNTGTVNGSHAFVNVTGGLYVGGLVGCSLATVTNALATGKITGSWYVGGLVGYNDEGVVIDSCSAGDVIGIEDDIGGLVGYSYKGTVGNSHSRANATGRDAVGGLVGRSSASGAVTSSYATGNVTGTGEYVGGSVGRNEGVLNDSYATGNVYGYREVGGLVGYNQGGTVVDSHAAGNVTGTDERVGGLVGDNRGTVDRTHAAGQVNGGSQYVGGLVGSNSGIVNDSYSTGDVNGSSTCVGGLVGYYYTGRVNNSHYNIDDVLINGEHNITTGGLFDGQYLDWLSSDLSLNISDYGASLINSGDLYDISSVQGFRDLLGFADVAEYKFHLAADIDLSAAPGLYMPYLAATFDGDNHTISHLKVDLPYAAFVGMFGHIYGGTVRFTNVSGNEIKGHSMVGGLVGYNLGGVVESSHATGNVTGTSFIGGLVGYNTGMVMCSSAKMAVTGENNAGGLVGRNLGTVKISYAQGNVTGTGNCIGGLVGSNDRRVASSYATGNVATYGDYIGGLVGNNDDTVEYSYSTGKVATTGNDAGGLVGSNFGTVLDSFWDKETSGQTSSPGGTGKKTAEMKTRSTFINASWDFTGIWCIVENVTYPFFIWQDTETPNAEAGLDQSVDEDTPVTFDGTGSSDDYGIADYTWTFTDGTDVMLYGARPSYQFDKPGIFVVTLNATDAVGHRATDLVKITVKDITAPVSVAGPDRTINEGDQVRFDGRGSSDNVWIVNYTWNFTDGAPVTLYDVQSTYRFHHPGTFVVTLTVMDAAGNRGIDTLTVTVNDITAPVADAGPDRTVDAGNLSKFDGTRSVDNVGIVNYTWTFSDRGHVVLHGDRPSHRFDVPGIFVVTLNVSDGAGQWDTDTVTVTVFDSTAPVADAGPDLVVDEKTLATLDGGRSSDNVGIVNYTWTFRDGAPVVLHDGIRQYRFDHPGAFEVTLRVADAAGNWASDTLVVTVKDRTAPVADAGADQTVDEGTPVIFDGSKSTDNTGISSYNWTFDYRGGRMALYGVSPDFIFVVPGVYVVTLNVSDAAGLWRADSMRLTVRDITPPVANAGPDQRVFVGSTVVLNGSLSTDNGVIGKYFWNFTYEGKPQSLEKETGSFTFDNAGTYEIVLTVIDGAGNRDEDRVVITVVPLEKEDGGLTGLSLILLLLIAMAVLVIASYVTMRKRRGRKDGTSMSPEEPAE